MSDLISDPIMLDIFSLKLILFIFIFSLTIKKRIVNWNDEIRQRTVNNSNKFYKTGFM